MKYAAVTPATVMSHWGGGVPRGWRNQNEQEGRKKDHEGLIELRGSSRCLIPNGEPILEMESEAKSTVEESDKALE